MDKKLIQIRQTERVMQLTWVINNICTNHCDYCPPTLHAGKNHHYEWEKAKSFITRLINHYPEIHCSISGGEPTVSPFFPELVNMFYEAGHTVGITTNGSRNARYWAEIAPKLSYICFSYHPSHHDPELLNKVRASAEYTQCSVRVMMDSRYWGQSMQFYKECLDIPYITVEPVRILPEMADRHVGDDYTDEQNKWLSTTPVRQPKIKVMHTANPTWRSGKTQSSFYYDDGSIDLWGDTNYIISSGQNDFRGWACNIGLESLFVHFDGWVKKGNCYQGGTLFHIDQHENYDLPMNAELCTQKICHCGTDVLISKVPILEKTHPLIVAETFHKKPKTEEEYAATYIPIIPAKKQK